ncbi:MAG: NADH-quinone oxidoreductase subunit C [Candidatus Sericytochromatia bacterium]|nr:NADH-quinone oxidoreductase subunit C [Candidatus Sericytochromatia bacterium]
MSATDTDTKLHPAEALQAQFPGAIVSTAHFRGDDTVVVRKEDLLALMTYLRDEPGLSFNFLMDVGGVDYLTYPEPRPKRFEVAYHLFSLRWGHRLRVKVQVGLGEAVPTLSEVWASADWGERECWEMFGISFDGHPNLRRLLTHKDFVGHPLRKDYPVKKRQPLSESDTMVEEMEQRLRFKGLK